MNTYRLLRNNKESGPFSLNELLVQGLKPYDLIWVENRSAAWRYPSEVEELKPHAPVQEEQPFDRFFKKSSSVQESISQIPQPKKEKPRFRITAVSRKIETKQEEAKKTEPVLKVEPSMNNEHSAYVPKDMHVSSSLATFNHYSNSNEFKSTAKENAVLETKYEGSLADIKRRYEEKILNAKPQRSFLFKYAWLLIIPVLAAGIWFGYEMSAKAESKGLTEITKPKFQNVTIPENYKPEEPQNELTKATVEEPVFTSIQKAKTITSSSKTVAKQDYAVKTVLKNDKVIVPEKTGEKIVPQRDEIILPAPQTSSTVSGNETGRQPRVRDTKVQTEVEKTEQPATPAVVVSKPKTEKPAAKGKRIDDYVVVDGDYKKINNSIQNLELKVENVTPYPIDLVVLDIQYFDKNGRLQKGETVYAKNIAPRRDVIVSAPSGSNAHSVGYKVSLVSAEKAGLYLVAE